MESGWPVGSLVGTEPELLVQYGVSRSVLREAIRIVEHHGVAAMRRGVGGGLIVTAPHLESVQRPLVLYLDYAGISTRDLFTVRTALEVAGVSILAGSLDDNGIALLNESLALEAAAGEEGLRVGAPYELHARIAELSGNAALALFVETLAGLGFERTHDLMMDSEAFAEQHRAHMLIVEAVIEGDSETAAKRMRSHLEAVAARYPRAGTPDPSLAL